MHLTEDTVEKLLKGQLAGEEKDQAVQHLLSQCPECIQLAHTVAARFGMAYLAGRFRKSKPQRGEPKKEDPVFEKLKGLGPEVRAKLVNERLVAAGQWASLQKHPQARRLAIIAADPVMHTWGLYDRLLDAAREIAPASPERGIEIAFLALAVADQLDPQQYGEARIVDLKAAATAVLGNCKRVAEDFEGARTDLEQALALLQEGTGDPLERANVLSLQGSWNVDLGFFEAGEKLFVQAIQIYEEAGETRLIGRTMLKQATAVGYVDPERAVSILDEATDYINSITEPLLELCMRHSLAVFLNDAGRTQEAIGVLEDSRGLYKQFPNPLFQLRLRWLEGRINRSLQNLREAEETFERVAADFLERGLSQAYLLCSIDLAEVVHAQGDRTRTLQICMSLYRALESWHMHNEGLSVMLLFVNAIREDTVQQQAFLNLARYIRRAWHLPQRVEDPVH